MKQYSKFSTFLKFKYKYKYTFINTLNILFTIFLLYNKVRNFHHSLALTNLCRRIYKKYKINFPIQLNFSFVQYRDQILDYLL
jgi:hypothetical protein